MTPPTLPLSAPQGDADTIDDILGVKAADPMKTRQAAALPHLELARLEEDATARTFIRAEKVISAAEALGRLPASAEAFHIIGGGHFSLFDLIPAVISLAAPASVEALHIATLSFSRDNALALVHLLDARRIGHLTFLLSHYFRATSESIAEPLVQALDARPHQARWFVVRNHAKILAFKLSDGRTVTIESSANLRSKANLEQFTVYGSPQVYAFHTGWLDSLYTKAQQGEMP